MRPNTFVVLAVTLFTSLLVTGSAQAQAAPLDPHVLVERALDLTRSTSSYSQMSMTIQRPSWQRTSSLVAWTRGREDSLIRFTAPAKDAGNALLKQGDKMWTYNPKLNRNIRLPSSMMSQSWAGSDFSYNDLSRSDKYLRHYDLLLTEETLTAAEVDGEQIRTYTIDAIPKEDAPVVWGKERMVIREDAVMLEVTYFDQSMLPVKRLVSLEIGEMGGRVMATAMRMNNLEEPDTFTEVRYQDIDFDIPLEDRMFTVFALQSGQTP
ncbi:MAG: outer membrane lipoprotein-sorting protein [bacterium]